MKPLGTHNYFVYILTNINKTVLYIGVTNNVKNRLWYHKNPESKYTFTSKYKCYYLVYVEMFMDINEAIKREKELKGWSREKKVKLINVENPEWRFLNEDFE